MALLSGRRLALNVFWRTNFSNAPRLYVAKYSSGGEKDTTIKSDAEQKVSGSNVSPENDPSGNTDTRTEQSSSGPVTGGGLDKVFSMFHRVEKAPGAESAAVAEAAQKTETSFASLLRRSKLMQIGDPDGRVVIGTVVESHEDDLYIDFGGKFYCVCKKPQTRAEQYHRGVKVRIRLRSLEMSSRFLGGERDITLLEADATLLGLHGRPRLTRQSSWIDYK